MNTKLHLWALSLFSLFFLNISSYAQTRKISGRIINGSGIGISGATISIKENHVSTSTDDAGNFIIPLADNGSTLVVSSIGFLPIERKLGTDENIIITLKDDPKQLTELVVTAYGIKKEQKRIGYSVQEIKGSELVKARDINPINSLAGKVAGLSVGASAEMLGRPQLVLRGSTDLLFVVGGARIKSDTWNISPDDIESYTILKGANASALYGFRGQNGAIIITTKRGSKDKRGWTVTLNSSNMMEHGFVTEPKSQTEYGRGSNYKYSYGDVLYDN